MTARDHNQRAGYRRHLDEKGRALDKRKDDPGAFGAMALGDATAQAAVLISTARSRDRHPPEVPRAYPGGGRSLAGMPNHS